MFEVSIIKWDGHFCSLHSVALKKLLNESVDLVRFLLLYPMTRSLNVMHRVVVYVISRQIGQFLIESTVFCSPYHQRWAPNLCVWENRICVCHTRSIVVDRTTKIGVFSKRIFVCLDIFVSERSFFGSHWPSAERSSESPQVEHTQHQNRKNRNLEEKHIPRLGKLCKRGTE